MKKILLIATLFVASMTVFVGCSKDKDDKGGSKGKESCWEIVVSMSGYSDSTFFWGTEAAADLVIQEAKKEIANMGLTGVNITKKSSSKKESDCVDPYGY